MLRGPINSEVTAASAVNYCNQLYTGKVIISRNYFGRITSKYGISAVKANLYYMRTRSVKEKLFKSGKFDYDSIR
jgi:hypothetical protein